MELPISVCGSYQSTTIFLFFVTGDEVTPEQTDKDCKCNDVTLCSCLKQTPKKLYGLWFEEPICLTLKISRSLMKCCFYTNHRNLFY